MKFSDCPNGFRVKHWRHLYDACISSPEALKKIADNTAFVVFDAEPWGGHTTKAAEIGISILRMAESWGKNIPPTTLSGFVKDFAVETHRIHLTGLERIRNCQPHRFGQEHYVPSIDAEEYIINLIDSHRQKYSITEDTTPDTQHVVFVVFDLQFEFRLLSTIYNGLTHYFTSWLDLQELARLASRPDKPGLSETLKACGFGYQDPKDLHTLNGRHNAATDTVRAAAILQHFSARLDSDLQLDIAASNRNASSLARRRRALPANAPDERKLWNGTRPKPRELYPYTARVRLSAGNVLTPHGLFEALEEYNPVAVGTAKQRTNRGA
jgi:hypothetical protein